MHVLRSAMFGLCVLVATAWPSFAQSVGRLSGVVSTGPGQAVAGASIDLTNATTHQAVTAVTSATGMFEFPRLPVGTYMLTVRLAGYETVVRPRVVIHDGRTAHEPVTLVSTTGVPDGRFDAGATALGATFGRDILLHIPTARDPSQVAGLAPGVMISSLDVAGAASGQSLSASAFGSGANVQWQLNGGAATDTGANTSALYYNFDAIDAVQVVTGGGDASIAASGVFINVVTRSGTNHFSGSATATWASSALQGQNVSQGTFDDGLGTSGSPLRHITVASGEFGGPIFRNRLWFWAAADNQDIDVATANVFDTGRSGCNPLQTSFAQLTAIQSCLADDTTKLRHVNADLTARLPQENALRFVFQLDRKWRNNAPATGANASPNLVQHGVDPTYQVTHTWMPAPGRFVASTQMTYVNSGFDLDAPDYGRCGSVSYDRALAGHEPTDPTCMWNIQAVTNRTTGLTTGAPSAAMYQTSRPSWETRTDEHLLVPDWLGGDHTFRFGVGWRRDPVLSYSHHGGGATAVVQCVNGTIAGCGNGSNVVPYEAITWRDALLRDTWQTLDGYMQDSYTLARLSVTGGARYDHQTSAFAGGCVNANVVVPSVLPAQCQGASGLGLYPHSWSPRLTATYSLTSDGRTTVHGSLAFYQASEVQLARQLDNETEVSATYGPNAAAGTCQPSSCWTDANHNGLVEASELVGTPTTNPPRFQNGVLDIVVPSIDANVRPSRTREVVTGLEREVRSTLRASLNVVYRIYDQGLAAYPYANGSTPASIQWVIDSTAKWQRQSFTDPNTAITAPYYTLCAGCSVATPLGSPTTYTITALARSTDLGVTAMLSKRLANHWQGQMSYTWNGTKVLTPVGAFSTTQPTVGNPTGVEFTNGFTNGTPPHDFKAFGYVELPKGFTAGGLLRVQSGSLRTETINGPGTVPSGTSTITYTTLTFQDTGTTRTPVTSDLDLNVAKALHLGRRTLTLTLNCFNVLNVATPLSYASDNASNNGTNGTLPTFTAVSSIVPPRVFRLDARISF